jgi:hypothetical protein
MAPASPIGCRSAEILLPEAGADLHRWAVIACDQFTSEPEYWERVEQIVGAAPSTLRMILPEVYLGAPDEGERVVAIRAAMHDYLEHGIFERHAGPILVERTFLSETGAVTRRGVMLALDLEDYDFRRGATSLIRATEGTIVERIPPRVRIRSGAPLELPHILVLIDDPERSVIEPLAADAGSLPVLYDFELMLGSGHVRGYSASGREAELLDGLARLASPRSYADRYGLQEGAPVLLFAVGDGNHSLATAKTIWEQIKAETGPDHPARHALVEVENIHDDGLAFEPIHRVIFDTTGDPAYQMDAYYADRCRLVRCASAEAMQVLVNSQSGPSHAIGIVMHDGCRVAYVDRPTATLPVGTLQAFLDELGAQGGFARIDYVHGLEPTLRLGSAPGNAGFYLPAMAKADLFRTVILEGALPRKTFSMGEAREKRFYMEARRIS